MTDWTEKLADWIENRWYGDRRTSPPLEHTEMSETTDDRAQWSIKGLSIEVRDMAIKAAKKRGMVISAWIEPAIRNQCNLEAGELVILPADRILPPDMAEASSFLQATAAFMAAGAAARAAGVKVSARAIGRAAVAGEAILRQQQGLPPIASPKPPGRRQLRLDVAAE